MTMAKANTLSPVEGAALRLRLIQPEDAEYVFGLRSDPAYNLYLSEVTGTADDQRRWIQAYKARELAGSELYYIIERLDGRSCGVVRLYEIAAQTFTWGSWILDAGKPSKAALESAYLIYVIAFDRLRLSEARFDVRRDNVRTISFHQKFGATVCGSDDENLYFVYPSNTFQADRARFKAILERGTAAADLKA